MWYEIDAVDRICDLSPDWVECANAGGAPGLVPSTVIGRPIWSFFEGQATVFHYAHIFETVRQTGRASTVRFRADGPGRESLLDLRVTPRPKQGLHIAIDTVRERAVRLSPLWNRRLARSSELVMCCSWCKRLKVDADWLKLSDAEQQRLDLRSSCPPEIVHHICDGCNLALSHDRRLAVA